jgi:hypothetical protein
MNFVVIARVENHFSRRFTDAAHATRRRQNDFGPRPFGRREKQRSSFGAVSFETGESRAMIHYSCDLCKRPLDPENELRYVVKLEVYAAFDPLAVDDSEDDRDNLQDLHEVLERMDDAVDDQIGDDVSQQMRFDLCPECRKKFVKNPLGRKTVEKYDFSKN